MLERIFKRKIYTRMLQWKLESDGQTALLIKGARRIGKSTISEEFARNELFYYTFKEQVEKGEGDDSVVTRNYGVDFLLSRKDKICPLEVKSSGYNSHKSLDKFQEKYSSRIKNRYLLYTKDVRKDKDIICLPVYMAGLL